MTGGSSSFNLPTDLLPILLPANASFYRIHGLGRDPCWFGPSPGTSPMYRFDAPGGQYRTLYTAERLEGAFAETVLRRPRQVVARPYVEARQWSVLQVRRQLRLMKLYDNGLSTHGVTTDICAGDDYTAPQAFAAAVFARYGDCDGIAYRARHNNGEICYALFDRVDVAHLHVVDTRQFVNERARADDLMRLHNAAWDPGTPLSSP